MARITLRQLLDHAAEYSYGVPAFNMNNMEQGLAIMAAAEATRSPVILQASRGARAYANDLVLARLIDGLWRRHPDIPVCMHLDHGNDEATCVTAIQHGFTSVMMDGSLKDDGKTPADYAYNAGITRRCHDMAHAGGVSVEGEIGVLGTLETGSGEQEDGHGVEGVLSHDQLLTDSGGGGALRRRHPCRCTGGGHGHQPRRLQVHPQARTATVLAMHVIEEIHRRLPDTHLVMHGSSSVPEELQEIINRSRRPDQADLGRARSRKSSAASSTACARSTSTPTTAWR